MLLINFSFFLFRDRIYVEMDAFNQSNLVDVKEASLIDFVKEWKFQLKKSLLFTFLDFIYKFHIRMFVNL